MTNAWYAVATVDDVPADKRGELDKPAASHEQTQAAPGEKH